MIAIGCDHGGLDLKKQLVEHLEKRDMKSRILAHIQVILVTILYMQRKWLSQLLMARANLEFSYAVQVLV